MGNVIHFYFPIFIQRFIDIYSDEEDYKGMGY